MELYMLCTLELHYPLCLKKFLSCKKEYWYGSYGFLCCELIRTICAKLFYIDCDDLYKLKIVYHKLFIRYLACNGS